MKQENVMWKRKEKADGNGPRDDMDVGEHQADIFAQVEGLSYLGIMIQELPEAKSQVFLQDASWNLLKCPKRAH